MEIAFFCLCCVWAEISVWKFSWKGFIQLYAAAGDGPLLPQPAGITIPGGLTQLGIFVFPWTLDSEVPPKGSSTLKQLKQRICTLSPALPCYTFPFFAFIVVIASNQISINCQILRELGWVFSKWCQGWGNHFVAAWCCLRSLPETELSCKCRSRCLKSSGKAQIRDVISGLFSSNVTSQRICLHTLFTFGFLLFYSRTDPKLMSGSRKKICVR